MPRNIKSVSDNTIREGSIRQEQRRRQEKKYEDKVVEYLEVTFCHTRLAAQTRIQCRKDITVSALQNGRREPVSGAEENNMHRSRRHYVS